MDREDYVAGVRQTLKDAIATRDWWNERIASMEKFLADVAADNGAPKRRGGRPKKQVAPDTTNGVPS